MPLKFMKPIKAEYNSQTIKPGMGENQYLTPFTIDEAESVTSRNLSSRNFPAMSVRPGRTVAFEIASNPTAFGARDNSKPHVLSGTVWKAWNGTTWAELKSDMAAKLGNFVDFTTGVSKYTVLATEEQAYSYDGTSLVELTEFPKTRLVAVHRFRMFALDKRELKFTAINLLNDWTTILEAGTITLAGATSDGTAIIEYADHVVIFTSTSMHELHGTNYDNFTLIDISDDGCTAEKTLIESGGVLYFLDGKEFKAYAGSKPQVISQKIQGYLKDIPDAYKSKACCGKGGKYIYLSIPYGTSATENNLVLEYDTELKQWYPHTGSFVAFTTIGETLYGIDPSGKIWNMDSGTKDGSTDISWYKESGAYLKKSVRLRKNLQSVYVMFDLPTGSSMEVSTSKTVDTADFVIRDRLDPHKNEQVGRIVLDANILGYADWYRLKLSGKGPSTVHAIEQYYRMER